MIKKRYGWLLVVFIVLLDITSKYFIKTNLTFGKSYSVLGNFLRFTYVENHGIAFGFLSDFALKHFWIKNITIFIIAVLILMFVIKEIKRETHFLNLLAFFMILGGALGNITERIFGYLIYYGQFKLMYGQVVDFIDVGIGSYRWFFFNIADSFVSVGVTLLIINFLFLTKHKEE